MQPGYSNRLHTVSSLILTATLLAACGGGSGGSSGDHGQVTPGSATQFTRMGMDVDPSGNRVSGDLGATVDTSANITFSTAGAENQAYAYNFTFPSGLPGGFISGLGRFVTSIGSANKNILILAPSLTSYVQNVLWLNNDNEDVYGFANAGYLLDPRKYRWPTSGTASYTGEAIQYVVDHYQSGQQGGYAVFTSTVRATLNYANRWLDIDVQPGVLGEGDIWGNSSMADVSPALVSARLLLNDLNFKGRYLAYDIAPGLVNGWGLGLDTVASVNFFGPNAEEMAGIVEYSSLATGSAHSDPNQPVTYQTISFALVKQ